MDLVIGRVVKAHGIGGEIVVEVRTDEPESRFTPGNTLHAIASRGRREQDYVVESARAHSGRMLVRLAGITDRIAAEALRGAVFVVDSAALPPLADPDEFYDHELQGLRVITTSGQTVGTIGEVLHTAAGELLAVHADGGEVLIPFVSAIVTSVSLAERTVEIDPPEGLLELG